MSESQLIMTASISAFTILFAIGLLIWLGRTAKQRTLRRRIKAASHAWRSDVFLPDGLDGYIHIDHLLLTDDAILVLDIKHPRGAIFGAPRMDEWTVIDSSGRHTFRNPLGALTDRTGAVKALVPGVNVRGLVVFIDGEFPKGVPPDVIKVEELAAANGSAPTSALKDAWVRLEAAITEASRAVQARD